MIMHGCGANGSIVLDVKRRAGLRARPTLLREFFQSLADQSKGDPIVERHGAEAFVEFDRGRVPIQDCPFEASASAFFCKSREMCEQCFADSASAHLRIDEEIFEIDSRLAEKGRVVVEEEDRKS